MYGVVSYGCVTAAGDSTEQLWHSLKDGRPGTHTRSNGSDLENLTRKLSVSFREMMVQAPAAATARLLNGHYGVILTSTKGCSNDFIWKPSAAQLNQDPLAPLLNSALKALELTPARSAIVSNACSGALAATRLAQMWLKQGLSDVVILAADAASDFVTKGFSALRLLSQQPARAFAADRDGFLLGEAAACFWVSHPLKEAKAVLHPIGLDSEGSAVTRPTASGASLVRAAKQITALNDHPPDLIIAHGTGTQVNDQTEDFAFAQMFSQRPFITGSKWCVGHTLATSGAIDMILACEVLRRRSVFTLHTTETADASFTGRYLTRGMSCAPPKRVLVSSLGFGGMHASALLEAAT